jgi:hypothetical protein
MVACQRHNFKVEPQAAELRLPPKPELTTCFRPTVPWTLKCQFSIPPKGIQFEMKKMCRNIPAYARPPNCWKCFCIELRSGYPPESARPWVADPTDSSWLCFRVRLP